MLKRDFRQMIYPVIRKNEIIIKEKQVKVSL